mmetsp:Transcript_87290/g.224831  ORF Transcript_87290/g.224831 Transcript_87290/m.224831 type:complete len:227 (+) Transcript_87290:111-791(+)
MNRPGYNPLLNQGERVQAAGENSTTSLAGRELPGDLVQQVSSLTVGQLFYILGHIQKLSAQAPVTAHALLAENPQICYALLHVECLAGMLEDPRLPMSAEELRRAKAMSRQMQEEVLNHELPPAMDQVSARSAFGKAAAPQPAFSKAATAHTMRSSPLGGARPGMAPPTAARAAPPPMGPPPVAGDEAQKQVLVQKLVHLSPDQIAKLPEQTKVQLLQFLQTQGGR